MSLHEEIIKNQHRIRNFFELYGVIPDLNNQEYLDFLLEISDDAPVFIEKLSRANVFSDALGTNSIKKDKFKQKHSKKNKPDKEYRGKLLELAGTTDTVEKFLDDLDT